MPQGQSEQNKNPNLFWEYGMTYKLVSTAKILEN